MAIEERKKQLIGGLVTARASVIQAARAVPLKRVDEVFLGIWSLQDLLADVTASHQQLVAFLEALPAKELVQGKVKRESGRSVTIRNLLQAEARDEAHHAEQVQAYFAQTKA